MARRSILLMVAAMIALLGTALIVMYVRGIDERATEGQKMVEVLTATATIESGEKVSAADEAGKFEKKMVRADDRVPGALTSTSKITNDVALADVFPGEQLLEANFGSPAEIQSLDIPDSMMAVSVELTDFERVAGFVQPGSEIAVFATGKGLTLLQPEKDIELGDHTRIVLPRTLVLGIGTTSVTSKTTKTEEGQESTEVSQTILTIAVTQDEAEKLIHADRSTDLTFALLTDETKSADEPGASLSDIFPEVYRAANSLQAVLP